MEEINYCSHCGTKWVAGSETCHECGMTLKRFRPKPDKIVDSVDSNDKQENEGKHAHE